MSEFLARMAARAMGVDPAATPRLPARFEAPAGPETTSTGEPAAVFAVAGPTAAPPGAGLVPGPAGGDPDTDTAPPPGLPGERDAFRRPSMGRAGSPVARVHRPGRAEARGRAPDAAIAAAPTPATARGLQPAPPSGSIASSAVPVFAGAFAASGERARARVVVAAMPPSQALPPRSADASASTAERQLGLGRGPDVVRVTIGRVDVRTVIASSTARPAPPAAPRTQPLPLADYLRGRREA